MVAATRATSSDLLRNMEFEIEEFPGCCRASTLWRLHAEYEDPEDVASASIGGHYIPENSSNLDKIGGNLRDINSAVLSFPLELANTYIIAEMYEKGHQEVFFACDSRSTRGDVHRGPFSTKNWIKWAKDAGYIDHVGYDIDYMRGWIFRLENSRARYAEARVVKAYNAYIDGLVARFPNAEQGQPYSGGYGGFYSESRW